MTPTTLTAVWLSGAVATLAWLMVRHHRDPERFPTSAGRHGLPATRPVAWAVYGLTAAIWPTLPFLELIDRHHDKERPTK